MYLCKCFLVSSSTKSDWNANNNKTRVHEQKDEISNIYLWCVCRQIEILICPIPLPQNPT